MTPDRFENIPEQTRRLLLSLDDDTIKTLRDLLSEAKLRDVEAAVKFFRGLRSFGVIARSVFIAIAAVFTFFAGASTALTWLSKTMTKFGASP